MCFKNVLHHTCVQTTAPQRSRSIFKPLLQLLTSGFQRSGLVGLLGVWSADLGFASLSIARQLICMLTPRLRLSLFDACQSSGVFGYCDASMTSKEEFVDSAMLWPLRSLVLVMERVSHYRSVQAFVSAARVVVCNDEDRRVVE